MKCSSCGARVNKSEEICPECGKYIAREAEHNDVQAQSEEIDYEKLEAAEAEVKAIGIPTAAKYIYKDYLLLPTLIRGGVGLVVLVLMIFYMIDSPRFRLLSSSRFTTVLAVLFAGFSLFSAIASVIQERYCYLDITDGKVSGVIPKGTFDTEYFEIDLAEIVAVEKTDFHSKHSHPKVIIISAEKRVEVRGSSGVMLSDFSDNLKKRIEK